MSNPQPAAPARRNRLATWVGTVLDALLPERCALCGQASANRAVCLACGDDLRRHRPPACPVCGDTSTSGDTCGRCLRSPPHFDAAVAAYVYTFPVDHLIHQLKYGSRLYLARWFAGAIAAALPSETFDLVVPMPLHPSRLAERGFNQAAEIARHLAPNIGAGLALAACVRNRPTPPQAELARERRLKNVKGAFDCRLDLSGRSVLLLDDVMTTGASLDELARVVRAAGARRVVAGAAARTMHGESA